MKLRKLAFAILNAATRRVPPELREWGNAMLHEIDSIESDWAALRWSIGGATAILRGVDLPITELSEVPARFERLRKTMRRNQYVGYATCLFLMAAFARNFFLFDNSLQQIGSILTVVGSGFLGLQIFLSHFQRGSNAINSPSTSGLTIVGRYKAALKRLHDFHCGIWFWSRAVIFLPGPLLFLIGFRIAHPELARIILDEAAVMLALAVFAVPLNLRLARKYQRQIDQLDRVRKEGR